MSGRTMAETIRLELRKGSYQMAWDTMPYETQAIAIAATLTAAGYASIADTLGIAANELDGMFSYGAGMNHDGTEDRDMMTAIQATHEAAEMLRERATKARESIK